MGTYIIRRLVHSIIVLFGITFFVFLLLHLSGDPVRLLLPFDATDEQYRAMKQAMGFNDPFFVQYFRFLERAVHLDFGMSLRNQVPVFGLISGYFKNTLLLATAAFLIALIVAIPAGITRPSRETRYWISSSRSSSSSGRRCHSIGWD